MASCTICHRLTRGFASPKGMYCSMECMNAVQPGGEAYMPYEEVESVVQMVVTKPLNQFSLEEAKDLTTQIVKTWIGKCREHAGITKPTPEWWSHEPSYLDQCVKQADPKNLVRSVADCFMKQCVSELPF